MPDGTVLAAPSAGILRFDGRSWTPVFGSNSPLSRILIRDLTGGGRGILRLATAEGLFSTDGTATAILDERDGLTESRMDAIHEASSRAV